MEDYVSNPHHRKRRRRRRSDKPAISARLVLDEHIKEEIGILSEDLYTEFFPLSQTDLGPNSGEDEQVRHVAISPWSPPSVTSTEDGFWTIVPVRAASNGSAESNHLAHSTVQLPSSSQALQFFLQASHAVAPTRIANRSKSGYEILILDVVPLDLDTVFVAVEGDLLKNIDEIHNRFGGGFNTNQSNGTIWKGKGKASAAAGASRGNQETQGHTEEERLTTAIRQALASPKVVHSGTLLSLPLPSHPITHVPPPPAKITMCEPVSQGLLWSSTRIIVTKSYPRSSGSRNTNRIPKHNLIRGMVVEEEEDTSNEQFFSAAEDRVTPSPPNNEEEETYITEIDESGGENDNRSDDSLEDMISLTAPTLHSQSSGMVSSYSAATPRAAGRQTNGTSTPGSVFSNYTSTTARPGELKSKIFRVQGLSKMISEETLHPRPQSDDDDASWVFIDTSLLVKVGCFSGDWVRLEASAEPAANGLRSWGLGALVDHQYSVDDWRAVRVFGLPEGSTNNSPRYPLDRSSRRSSFPYVQSTLSIPLIYLSPILLANIHAPSYVRISPLFPMLQDRAMVRSTAAKSRINSFSSPPTAKEVTLLKISAAVTTDRALQPVLLAELKQHFEARRRIVKSGDMIAITVDMGLGRTLHPAASLADPELESETLFTSSMIDRRSGSLVGGKSNLIDVAWFKLDKVIATQPGETLVSDDEESWGGVAVIDPTSTRMVQAGTQQGMIPGTVGNLWEYYLGIKPPPQAAASSLRVGDLTVNPPKQQVSRTRRRLRELISAATCPRAMHLKMKPVGVLLASTQRNIGKATIFTGACADLGLHIFIIDAYDILTEGGAGGGDVKTEAFLKARAERALSCGPEYTVILIRHIDALSADRMIIALKEILAKSRVVVATTTAIDKVSEGVRGLFTHELEMSAPDEGERQALLSEIIQDKGARLAPDVDLAATAVKTAALVAGDLVDVVERAIVAKRERLEKLADVATKQANSTIITLRDVQLSGGDGAHCIVKADLDVAVDAARKNFADSIGAPKIPNVSWEDVGGLTNVKDAVMETIQLPLERPELFAKGMKKRSGILFYGPPGTGKTLLAKAIATEFSLNFFSVKGPELLNMYIGESEANVRRVFQRARDARPCVVFFDELDSVAPKRGNQGDSGGVMDRIVSQLLAELDGMSNGDDGAGGVFVIGATNRPDLLDQALLRPGRFDKMLYLGVSDTHDKQLTILEALTRKFTLHPEMSLRRVAEALPFTYTGADLYALCSDAMLKAITRRASAVDAKIRSLPDGAVTTAYFFDHLATKEDIAVMVTEEDFFAAQQELVGSVR